ncbi:uncharacterized protein METZ01_LOCUS441758, partial [marine metagenome]
LWVILSPAKTHTKKTRQGAQSQMRHAIGVISSKNFGKMMLQMLFATQIEFTKLFCIEIRCPHIPHLYATEI